MAAGDRYSSGKPKDLVRHIWANNDSGLTLCGRKNIGYASTDWSDVTCLICLKKKVKLLI